MQARKKVSAIGLAGGLLALAWLGCELNAPAPPLPPTGGTDNSCLSDYDLIQLVGDYTTPVWTVDISPAMTLGPGCVWSTVARFEAGDRFFKFVTGGQFDNPDDFGWQESQTLRVGVDNPVRLVSGTGTAIKVNVPVSGCYLVRLFEQDLLFRVDPTDCSTGGIRGRVEFEDDMTPPFPRVRVQALLASAVAGFDSSDATDGTYEIGGLSAGTYDVSFRGFGYLDSTLTGVVVDDMVVEAPVVRLRAGCVSANDSIQVAGQFTTPPFDLSVSPRMTQVEGCIWEARVRVAAGTHLFKLVTNGAFDSPSDYGGDEAVTLLIDTDVPVREVSGTGTALKMQFPFDGDYLFRLDEERLVLRVSAGDLSGDLAGVLVFEGRAGSMLPQADVDILRGPIVVANTRSAALDGSFAVTSLDAGVYDIRCTPPLRAPTHLDTTLAGVTVAGGLTHLGQIFLPRAPGGVQGAIGFSNLAAPPYPAAVVTVRAAAATVDSVLSSTTTGGFASTGLRPGTYDVRIAAAGYIDTTFALSVGRSMQTLGPITLRALVCASYPTITQIQLGGREINNNPDDRTFTWNLGLAPVMDHVGPCRWETSVTCPNITDYRIKFIANADFGGDPPDFGGDNMTLVPPDSLAGVVTVTAPSVAEAIVIRITNPGVYRFRLDADTQTFLYTRTGDLPVEMRRAAAVVRRGRGPVR
jgi:hypothetical protein